MAQADEQAILSDIKKRFGIEPEKIAISELHPATFPPGTKLFRADKRGSHGNIYYNYIKEGDEFYCSADETSFARLLAAQRLLTHGHWNGSQFAALFLHLVVRNLELVESPQQINMAQTADSPLKARAAEITAATLEVTPQGGHAHFWTYQPRYQKLESWQVKISADYKVSFTRE
jgi:hypothetical protein